MNGFWNPIVGNKLVVSQVLAAHGIPHPRVFGLVSQGRPLTPGPGRPAAAALMHEWTADTRPVVFRPHWSGGGEGVFFGRRDCTAEAHRPVRPSAVFWWAGLPVAAARSSFRNTL